MGFCFDCRIWVCSPTNARRNLITKRNFITEPVGPGRLGQPESPHIVHPLYNRFWTAPVRILVIFQSAHAVDIQTSQEAAKSGAKKISKWHGRTPSSLERSWEVHTLAVSKVRVHKSGIGAVPGGHCWSRAHACSTVDAQEGNRGRSGAADEALVEMTTTESPRKNQTPWSRFSWVLSICRANRIQCCPCIVPARVDRRNVQPGRVLLVLLRTAHQAKRGTGSKYTEHATPPQIGEEIPTNRRSKSADPFFSKTGSQRPGSQSQAPNTPSFWLLCSWSHVERQNMSQFSRKHFIPRSVHGL